MIATLTYVGNCFVGSGRGYIYILYSKTQHILYVGQTNDQNGVVGRLYAHVGISGTLRMRLFDNGIELNEVDDLYLFSYSLPRDSRYTGIDRTYREGVEYLVQKRLHTVRGRLNPYMNIISHVDYNDAAQLVFVMSTAQEVFASFLSVFSIGDLS